MSLGTFGGVRTFKIASLKRGAREQQRVQNAATGLDQSVKVVGLLQFPLVRITKKGPEVIFGEHRVTALESAGETTVECRVWSGSDAEADELRRAENHARKHWTPEEIAAAVARAESAVVSQRAIGSPPSTRSSDHLPGASKPGITPTSRDKGEARKAIAAATGKTPEAVRMAERRARESAPEEAPSVSSAPLQPGETEGAVVVPAWFQTLGMKVGGLFLAQVEKLAADVDEMDRTLREAQGNITRLEKSRYLSKQQAQETRDELHRAAHAIRQLRPAAVCGYCKDPGGVAGRREQCNGCHTFGWLNAGALENMPLALRDTGVVSVNGEVVRLVDAPASKPAQPAKPRGLQIEMPDGKRFTPGGA
jgi:ParB-like chromosome segregation protein Spo0J